MIKITTPLTDDTARNLKVGDQVLISGVIYTGRDAAHKRLVELIEDGKEAPFDIKNSIIYYVGPSPAKPGDIIGSAGPTTSYRMDSYAPVLIEKGLTGMIGKGKRGANVIESMKKNTSVYFAAVGGAAALLADRIKSAKVIAFDDLGTEAIRELVVEDFPVIVVNDCKGNDLYEIEKLKYFNL